MGSIERYGVIKGVWLSTKRVLRCNSLSAGGFDPVAAEGSLEAMGTDPSEDALRTEISRNSQGKR